jgi:hypothetical protein
VKDLLMVFLTLLVSFVIVAACTGGFIAVTSGYLPLNLERLTHIILTILPFSVASSVFFTGYRMYRKPPKLFFLSYLMVFLLMTIAFFGLYSGFAGRSQRFRKSGPTREAALRPGEIVRNGRLGLYTEHEDEGDFTPLIVADPDSKDQVLKLFPSARFDAEAGLVADRGKEKAVFPIYTERTSRGESLVTDLRSDIGKLNAHTMKTFFLSERGFLIIVLSIVLFFLTASFLLRLTRWPLFNAALFIFAFRGFFLMYGLFVDDRVTELGRFFLPSRDMNLLPAYLALGFALLFLLWGLILVRAERKGSRNG